MYNLKVYISKERKMRSIIILKRVFVVLSLFVFTGCSLLSPQREENEGTIAIKYTIKSYGGVILPRADIYLKNIETNKEKRLTIFKPNSLLDFSSSSNKMKILNLPEGNYIFSRWEYNACKKMNKNNLYCKEFYNFKGETGALSDRKFHITRGETIYLGHIIFDTGDAMLSMEGYKGDTFTLNKVKIKNISDKMQFYDWEFKMTGYKNIVDNIKEIFN